MNFALALSLTCLTSDIHEIGSRTVIDALADIHEICSPLPSTHLTSNIPEMCSRTSMDAFDYRYS